VALAVHFDSYLLYISDINVYFLHILTLTYQQFEFMMILSMLILICQIGHFISNICIIMLK